MSGADVAAICWAFGIPITALALTGGVALGITVATRVVVPWFDDIRRRRNRIRDAEADLIIKLMKEQHEKPEPKKQKAVGQILTSCGGARAGDFIWHQTWK